MSRPPEVPDESEPEQLPGEPEQPFRPFVPGPRQPADDAEPTLDSDGPRAGAIPAGLSRRDRREWRAIEAERLAEARDAGRTPDRWSSGFARKPPKGLGRRGRRVFREEDRRRRSVWWARQKDRDLDTRGVGVLVITLLVFGVILVRLLWPSGDRPSAAGGAATAVPVSSPPVAATFTPSTAAVTASADPTTAATPSAAVADTASSAAPSPPSSTVVFGNGTNTATSVPAQVTRAADVTAVLPSGSTALVIAAAPTGAITTAGRSTPVAAAAAWFARTCPSSWRERYGAALIANRSVMTGPAWAYANPAGDALGQRWWAGAVKARQTRRCTTPAAALFGGPQPANKDLAVVTLSADRLVTAPGAKPVVEKVFQLRYMARAGSVWSVGPLVVGG